MAFACFPNQRRSAKATIGRTNNNIFFPWEKWKQFQSPSRYGTMADRRIDREHFIVLGLSGFLSFSFSLLSNPHETKCELNWSIKFHRTQIVSIKCFLTISRFGFLFHHTESHRFTFEWHSFALKRGCGLRRNVRNGNGRYFERNVFRRSANCVRFDTVCAKQTRLPSVGIDSTKIVDFHSAPWRLEWAFWHRDPIHVYGHSKKLSTRKRRRRKNETFSEETETRNARTAPWILHQRTERDRCRAECSVIHRSRSVMQSTRTSATGFYERINWWAREMIWTRDKTGREKMLLTKLMHVCRRVA